MTYHRMENYRNFIEAQSRRAAKKSDLERAIDTEHDGKHYWELQEKYKKLYGKYHD